MHPVLTCLQTTVAPCVGHPVLRELLEKGDFVGAATFQIDPAFYPGHRTFSVDNSVVTLLKKCAGLIREDDLHQKAVEVFYACERKNASTNARLDKFIDNKGPFEPSDEPVIAFIERWRKIVARVLGTLPRTLEPRFSGGSTYHDKGRLTTLPDKLTSVPGATREAIELFYAFPNAWTRMIDQDRRQRFELTRGNRFTSVPKDSFKNRGICIEPLANVCLQLDVGKVIRRKLLARGIDLEENQQLHRDLAQLGSLSGDLATIDLSNASDTVCLKLVKLVLPDLWYDLLFSLRSPFTQVDGKWVKLEKFSSMGNGFTFELETLLYFTLCEALGAPSKVYGDDIVVYTEDYESVTNALKFFGFEPNTNKSFNTGPFRESCGGDFFRGHPVRGPYMKKLPEAPQDWIALHNALARYEEYGGDHFSGLRALCLESVPLAIRKCVGPVILGDVCFHLEEVKTSYRLPRWNKPWERPFHKLPHVRIYRSVAKTLPWSHWTPQVHLVSALAGADPHRVQPRDSISGYTLAWACVTG